MRRYTIWDLLIAGKCEKRLWLRARDSAPAAEPERREPLPIEAALALWPGCARIDPGETAWEDTLRAVRSGACAIWGAFARSGALEYRADVLVRREDGAWDAYIDGNSVHPRESLAREAAFAALVFEANGVRLGSARVLLANPEYVRHGDADWRAIYREWDITERAASHQRGVAALAARLEKIAGATAQPEIPLCENCLKPRECPYWEACSASLPDPNVFSISGLSNRRKFQLYRQGVVSYADCLARGKLTRAQSAQVVSDMRAAPPRADVRAIRAFLSTLWYPMCFLDFESYQPLVPPYDDLRPFEQLAFQYSLHVRETEGARLSHHVFLAEPGVDPRPGMAESLARSIPKGSCVIVYSNGLEKHVLCSLAERFPEHREALMAACASLRDLIVPFRSRAYYAKEMRGSCSLKSVLPAMCPELSYAALEGVHNGEDAMRAYTRLSALPADERETRLNELIAYCSLDTYAMARILDALRAAVIKP